MIGKSLYCPVGFFKKQTKKCAASACHRDFTVTCDGSYFVVDIFFGNPLLNLELFSEELWEIVSNFGDPYVKERAQILALCVHIAGTHPGLIKQYDALILQVTSCLGVSQKCSKRMAAALTWIDLESLNKRSKIHSFKKHLWMVLSASLVFWALA